MKLRGLTSYLGTFPHLHIIAIQSFSYQAVGSIAIKSPVVFFISQDAGVSILPQ
jgi:hypothetical protein